MDFSLSNLDIRPIYAGEMTRQKRRVFPVRSIGLATGKREWVHRPFETINFSFIFAGGGRYLDGERSYEVEAPCVLTQWPGEKVSYGPGAPWGEWDELFVIFDEKLKPMFEAALLADRSYPIWRVEDVAGLHEAVRELANISRRPEAKGWVEELDLACERLIMVSRPLAPPVLDPDLANMAAIRGKVDASFSELESVDEIALRYGYSRSSFRRHWSRLLPVPPQRYLAEAKIRHACRLLVETRLTIGEIADQVGFADPLYFSRKFRKMMGKTASAYRQAEISKFQGHTLIRESNHRSSEG